MFYLSLSIISIFLYIMGGIEDAQAGSTKRRGAEPRFLGQGERMRLNARPKGEEISEKLLVIISLYIISLYMSLC